MVKYLTVDFTFVISLIKYQSVSMIIFHTNFLPLKHIFTSFFNTSTLFSFLGCVFYDSKYFWDITQKLKNKFQQPHFLGFRPLSLENVEFSKLLGHFFMDFGSSCLIFFKNFHLSLSKIFCHLALAVWLSSRRLN